jgi:holdfast attachment protein HfaA
MREAKLKLRRRAARLTFGVGVCAAASALAVAASAQDMNGSVGRFNGGFGGANLNRSIDISTRDQNNNQVFVNGRMTTPEGSVFSQSTGFSRSGSGGVGGGGVATAIGNNLSVVVQGSWNRVTVDSTQINNGDISAQTSLNGSLDLQ